MRIKAEQLSRSVRECRTAGLALPQKAGSNTPVRMPMPRPTSEVPDECQGTE